MVLRTIADAAVAHIFGVAAFVIAALAAFTAVGPDQLAVEPAPERHDEVRGG